MDNRLPVSLAVAFTAALLFATCNVAAEQVTVRLWVDPAQSYVVDPVTPNPVLSIPPVPQSEPVYSAIGGNIYLSMFEPSEIYADLFSDNAEVTATLEFSPESPAATQNPPSVAT